MFAVLAGISSCVMLPGKLIIKNTVMRKGNQKLLNSLKESVIVAHRLTGNVIFANTATERLNSLFVEGLCKVGNLESFSTGMNESSVFDREEKQFALFNSNLLSDMKASPEEIIEHIDGQQNYISFAEVITMMLARPEDERKAIYKNIVSYEQGSSKSQTKSFVEGVKHRLFTIRVQE